ncbi:MAG: Rne/Rng family ribonuclease, partial [Candidatus Korobacteraceae bacterium]
FAAEDAEDETGETTATGSNEQESGDGARRWRGRRRRGGRRGGRDDRYPRQEAKTEPVASTEEAAAPAEPVIQARPEAPARYAPIVLPGESISKYRNRTPAAEPVVAGASAAVTESPAPTVIEDFVPSVETRPVQEVEYEDTEEVVETHAQQEEVVATAPEHHEAHAAFVDVVEPEPPAVAVSDHDEVIEESSSETPQNYDRVETAEHGTVEVASETTESADDHHEPQAASETATDFHQHSAPSEAPAGRTLEHETLEDDEMEFHPVPENIEELREVAGDLELELEEETLDSCEGYSERWIPKVADVDEDEVVAAEERGETRLAADEDEEEGEEEEVNGRAELRSAPPTAGYQQRQGERQGFNRRNDRDRGRRGGGGRRNNVRANSHRPVPLISELLKEGQEILIQIAKEPIAKKGARITSHIALPGRFLVYMPTVNHTGVSRKINSEEERMRLKRIVTSERENGLGGFIVRTAAANIKEDELRADIRFLKHLWAEIKSRADDSKSPALIYHDLNLVERVLRDQVNADFSQIWVDTEEEYERVVRFAQRFQPSLVKRIKLYTKDAPLYEHFGIQDEINNALKSKVWLKTGGYIVINQTEALVAIDINTGKYVGKTQRLEDTIVKTNVDAVKEIVRQIRLRDLGGIIVIDFIDMDERKNRQRVMQALEEALRTDRAPSKALQFNDFGLVAITRKRVKQSLERTLGESCPYCVGAGFVKSVPTVCNELYIEMRKMIKQHDRTDISLRVNPEVAKALKANNGKLIGEMEELTGKTVLVKSDPMLHQENFDIQ